MIINLNRLLYAIMLGIMAGSVFSQTNLTKNQAELQLKQVQNKIVNLKSRIAKAHHQHQELQYKIANTVKLIKNTQSEKAAINHKALVLQTEINKLQTQLTHSQTNIKNLENLLFQQLNLHVELATEPPLQVVFGADNPFEYYQQLELYHFLFASEQQALNALHQQKKSVQIETHHLKQKVSTLEQLKQQLNAKELSYLKNKEQHHHALEQLSAAIHANTNALHANEKNQIELRRLLTMLLKENRLQSSRPFTVMKKRLNYPIQLPHTLVQKSQNGLIFKAPLGTKVHAVSPGRIVFADWLNGYGYLVIVDHGWGFMTLYGNNQTLLKHKGDNVSQGDVVASVGQSGTFHQQGLYFEIRQKAHVVSALEWFQKHG